MAQDDGCVDLRKVRGLIREKEHEYQRSHFSPGQNSLLRIISDLAHELDSIEDFYRLCVVAPDVCLGLVCALYLPDEQTGVLSLACDSASGVPATPVPVPGYLHAASAPYAAGSVYVLPIRCPESSDTVSCPEGDEGVFGFFVLEQGEAELAEPDLFFLDKYIKCITAQLHGRLLSLQNVRHLKFINGLVMDIEHNVIVPNMYFRHLFNNLKKSIAEVAEIEKAMGEFTARYHGPEGTAFAEIQERVDGLHRRLAEQHQELLEHHSTTSLFLESLFRRDHFVQGHLVLRPRYCKVEEEIISPQLVHFASRFAARQIVIEPPADMGGEELLLVVDVGLLSQVYANLFSNALKYVEAITDHRGNTRKAVTYGREFVANYFGPSRHGIKLNVFTTGRHLRSDEAKNVFKDGFRGAHSKEQPGSGHGLSFVKQVIDIHGGVVGYEATEEGNNFYFVLPLPSTESAVSVIVGPPQLP